MYECIKLLYFGIVKLSIVARYDHNIREIKFGEVTVLI
jgi:hypothetical protein